MKLYHSSFFIIENPDLKHGRINADFGQGFYLSSDKEFVLRWSKRHLGKKTYINEYELDTRGLKICRFERNIEWFSYILNNRSSQADDLLAYDVIEGPIANDTIYDTWGLLSSGIFSKEESLRLLQLGPSYTQLVIKSEKALSQLQWLNAEELSDELLSQYKEVTKKEELAYQTSFSKLLEQMEKEN